MAAGSEQETWDRTGRRALNHLWERARQQVRHTSRSDEAFSMMEVVVALLVLVLVLTAIGFELSAQVTSVSASRNEQAGEGLLTKALAEVRAMPYKDVAQGLSDKDTSTSTARITKSGTTWTFTDTEEHLHGTGETILHYTPGTTPTVPPPPFFPHSTTTTVNGVTFSVSSYPTKYETPPVGTPAHAPVVVSGVIRVTVIVSWNVPGHGGPTTLVGQTLVYSAGSDCLGGSSSPFAAPCKPNFSASASAGLGTIEVQPAPTAPYPIQGIAFTSFGLLLGGATSVSDLVQVSTVLGSAQTTGAASSTHGSTGTTDQITEVSTAASNDPASGDGSYQRKTVLQSATSVTDSGTGTSDTITASPSVGDTGDSVSTVSATATQNCDSIAGTDQVTSLPCGSGAEVQKAQASLKADLFAGTTNLGTAVFATVTAQPGTDPNRTYSARINPGTGTCPITATTLCVAAGAQMFLGSVSLAELPSSVTAPSGWSPATGLVSLTGYSASVSTTTRSGTSGPHSTTKTSVPVAGATKPRVSYWNGTGYTAITLPVSPELLPIQTVTATDPSAAGGTVTVTVAAQLSVTGVSHNTVTATACKSACQGDASVPSLISGTVSYQVVQGTTVICDLEMTVNLGSVVANTSYQEAS